MSRTSGRRASALLFAMLCAFVTVAPAQEARAPVSRGIPPVNIDDLVTRARIVLAAISPDGRHAAYLVARGNPSRDVYEMTLEVVDTRVGSTPPLRTSYELDGSELFDGHDSARPSAAGLYWTARNELLFTAKSGTQMRLAIWTPGSTQPRVLLEGHDKILLDDRDRVTEVLQVLTRDVIAPGAGNEAGVMDRAWRMSDDDRFFGEPPNLKTGAFVRDQKWTLSFDARGTASIVAAGATEETWEQQPAWPISRPPEIADKIVDTASEQIFPYAPVASPQGKRSALTQHRTTNRDRPGESEVQFPIVVYGERGEQVIVPGARSSRVPLGWAAERGPVYFLETRHEGSVVRAASLQGKVADVAATRGLLEKPCVKYGRLCQVVSADARLALLVRSTNTTPDELVLVDLKQGAIRTLAAPNAAFATKQAPEVRFYEIESLHGKAWGRLYLPTDFRAGTRYPLVISLYVSTPGFYASVGDELPVLPLTANGIVVFAMNAGSLGPASKNGDFRVELARVEEPLRGLEWIVEKLTQEGIIDPQRVGVSGLSYGAEIAMYAYGKTDLFAAVSTASASWNPSLFAMGGPHYARSLLERGLTAVDNPEGLRDWHELAASLKPRAHRPPLLIQGANGEQILTAPTWTELRLAGAPVEWFDYPEADSGHVKARPANKWWVYTRNLDWFRFWLQGYADPAPMKAEQYARWRGLEQRDR